MESLVVHLCNIYDTKAGQLHKVLDNLKGARRHCFIKLLQSLELYVVGSNRQITFSGLSVRDTARQTMYPYSPMKVFKYYQEQLKTELHFTDLPCIIMVSADNVEYFPFEVLYVKINVQ